MYVAVGMLAANLALATPAPGSPAPAPALQEQAAVVSENWTAAPAAKPSTPPATVLIERAARESIADEKAQALARSKEAAIPTRYFASSNPQQDKYEKFETAFAESKVPGCLQPDGLKRQPTFIFGGLLALPFIAVAAIRGKCN